MVHLRSARPSIQHALLPLVLCLAVACVNTTRARRSNALDYLYPEGKAATTAELVRLELPIDVGIAFVPEANDFDPTITPGAKQDLLGRVREAFVGADGIGRIEVIPDSFLTRGGGFENVAQIRSALGVDVIALVSYDQTQFDDPNLASVTYWTIVGAYVIPGNENETHTLVHATVFDIASQAMLLNASGMSTVTGRATMVDLERSLREDRATGFGLAVDDMVQNLQLALAQFREQIKSGTVRGHGTPAVETISAPGTGSGAVGAGALGVFGLLLGCLVVLTVPPQRRRA